MTTGNAVNSDPQDRQVERYPNFGMRNYNRQADKPSDRVPATNTVNEGHKDAVPKAQVVYAAVDGSEVFDFEPGTTCTTSEDLSVPTVASTRARREPVDEEDVMDAIPLQRAGARRAAIFPDAVNDDASVSQRLVERFLHGKAMVTLQELYTIAPTFRTSFITSCNQMHATVTNAGAPRAAKATISNVSTASVMPVRASSLVELDGTVNESEMDLTFTLDSGAQFNVMSISLLPLLGLRLDPSKSVIFKGVDGATQRSPGVVSCNLHLGPNRALSTRQQFIVINDKINNGNSILLGLPFMDSVRDCTFSGSQDGVTSIVIPLKKSSVDHNSVNIIRAATTSTNSDDDDFYDPPTSSYDCAYQDVSGYISSCSDDVIWDEQASFQDWLEHLNSSGALTGYTPEEAQSMAYNMLTKGLTSRPTDDICDDWIQDRSCATTSVVPETTCPVPNATTSLSPSFVHGPFLYPDTFDNPTYHTDHHHPATLESCDDVQVDADLQSCMDFYIKTLRTEEASLNTTPRDNLVLQPPSDPRLPEEQLTNINVPGLPEGSVQVGASAPQWAVEKLKVILAAKREAIALKVPCKFPAHKIRLKPDAKPVQAKPRRRSPAEREVISTMVNQQLQTGIIQPSTSEWNSEILVLDKPLPPGLNPAEVPLTDRKRAVISYKGLNAQCEPPSSWAIPDVSSVVEKVSGSSLFSVYDIKSAFYQQELSPESRHLTAFATDQGLFEYCRLPQGLLSSPQAWCSAVTYMLQHCSHNRHSSTHPPTADNEEQPGSPPT